MNDLLRLSGAFETKGASGPGAPSLPAKAKVTSTKIKRLGTSLETLLEEWSGEFLIKSILVSIEYRQIVAKSNRVRRLLKGGIGQEPEATIRSARYLDIDTPRARHVMTHYVPKETIISTINELREAARIVDNHFSGSIDKNKLNSLWDEKDSVESKKWKRDYSTIISKSAFSQLIRDCHYVEKIYISDAPTVQTKTTSTAPTNSLVTLYRTEVDIKTLLQKLDLNVAAADILDNTVQLSEEQYYELTNKAPYLVAMSINDLSSYTPIRASSETVMRESNLPLFPSTEPVIGVIDTAYEQKSLPYFHNWVEYKSMLPEDVEIRPSDTSHGTSVDSLIIDGPRCNPWLEDGCGNFRVKHFGVATGGNYSSFTIMTMLRKILSENPGIKVWNLSLGSDESIDHNSISPEAALLDKLQAEYDVLFVVAGTNNHDGSTDRIGSPADSVNALVVNSVRRDKTPASYTRRGPVLHFQHKPDVSYYGGDIDEPLNCYGSDRPKKEMGTSLAAPLVARKAAYLIYKMHLSCESAKALLIDSSKSWNQPSDMNSLGYGVVPIHINDVIKSRNDEIKFLITGTVTDYETYNYKIPIPAVRNTHPSVARATLCYFPKCNRDQGVDYTCTELDLHFGRLNKGKLSSLKANTQGEKEDYTDEETARKSLQKWDNTKSISDSLTNRSRPKKAYENPLWGLKIRKTSRYQDGSHEPQRFAVVITVRELDGVNRIDSFIQQCNALGWQVNRIRVENELNIYEESQVEVDFE